MHFNVGCFIVFFLLHAYFVLTKKWYQSIFHFIPPAVGDASKETSRFASCISALSTSWTRSARTPYETLAT